MVLKPTPCAGFSFCSTEAEKTCFAHITLHRCCKSSPHRTRLNTAAASPRLTGHDSPQNFESVCSTKLRVLAARFEGAGGLYLEVSLGTWGADPVLYQLFAIQNRRTFPIRKNHSEIGQAPTSQARPRDTDHLRPSNLAAEDS